MPVYRFEDLPDVLHNPKLSTARGPTVKGDRIFFGKRTKTAGTGSKPHHHPCEEFLYVLKGRIRAEIEGEVYFADPGGVVHIPANVVHCTSVEGGEDADYLYVKDTTWGLTGVPADEDIPETPPEDVPY